MPLPEPRPSFWLGAGFLFFGLIVLLGWLLLLPLALERGVDQDSGLEIEEVVGIMIVLGAAALAGFVVGIVLLRKHGRDQPRIRILKCLGKLLGLSYRTHIGYDEIEHFLDLPLFSFAWSCNSLRGGFSLRGQIDNQEVWLFDLAYAGVFHSRDIRDWSHRARQTVVLLPATVPLPDFVVAPLLGDWSRLLPHWPVLLEAGEPILDVDGQGGAPARLYGKDREEVQRLFSPDRLAELGNLGGWQIECRSGDLLVYRPGERVPASAVQALLKYALDVKKTLIGPVAASGLPPPQASAERPDQIRASKPWEIGDEWS
jgi:hypothetical protein